LSWLKHECSVFYLGPNSVLGEYWPQPPCPHGGQFRRSTCNMLKSFRYGYARNRQESVRHWICYSVDQI